MKVLILKFALYLLCLLAHSIGLFLLSKVPKGVVNETQRIFIFNLSLAELLIAIFGFVKDITTLFDYKIINYVHHISCILVLSWISIVYYQVMFYLTMDRFFQVYLNLKYPIYWTEHRTKKLILFIWFFAISFYVTITYLYFMKNLTYSKLLYGYLYPALNISFLTFAIIVYGYIGCTFKKRQHQVVPVQVKDKHGLLLLKRRRSGFFLPFLLVISFLILVVIPDLTLFILSRQNISVEHHMKTAIDTGYQAAFVIDAILYIYMLKPVRHKLWRCLKRKNKIYKRRLGTVDKIRLPIFAIGNVNMHVGSVSHRP